MTARDEFKKSVLVVHLASRVGYRCSSPDCRRATSGPESTTDGSVNIGVAAHITAAASGGPRFDPQLSQYQRSGAANGIWLCQSCAKLIDSDESRFTRMLLLDWKSSGEIRARLHLQTPERPQSADEPILVLPSSDPAVSWLPFSARATTFVGRDAERAQLDGFLQSSGKFSRWLLTGAADLTHDVVDACVKVPGHCRFLVAAPRAIERASLRLVGGAQSVRTRGSVSARRRKFCGFRVPVKGNCPSRLRRKNAR
jgi:hypothetical protein